MLVVLVVLLLALLLALLLVLLLALLLLALLRSCSELSLAARQADVMTLLGDHFGLDARHFSETLR